MGILKWYEELENYMTVVKTNGDLKSHNDLSVLHNRTKATRQRGDKTPSHLALVKYLKSLESELKEVHKRLATAWIQIDDTRNFMKAMIHMDQAQQRMHRVIRKLEKKEKKK
jgi:hypothetical protein